MRIENRFRSLGRASVIKSTDVNLQYLSSGNTSTETNNVTFSNISIGTPGTTTWLYIFVVMRWSTEAASHLNDVTVDGVTANYAFANVGTLYAGAFERGHFIKIAANSNNTTANLYLEGNGIPGSWTYVAYSIDVPSGNSAEYEYAANAVFVSTNVATNLASSGSYIVVSLGWDQNSYSWSNVDSVDADYDVYSNDFITIAHGNSASDVSNYEVSVDWSVANASFCFLSFTPGANGSGFDVNADPLA